MIAALWIFLFAGQTPSHTRAAAAPAQEKSQEKSTMQITPMIYVQEIEPSLPFWIGRLGFEKIAEVPEGNKLGFVMLKNGDAQLMIQTRSGVGNDLPVVSEMARPSFCLYVVVNDFEDLKKRLAGADTLIPERTTFYHMREILIREPGGNLVLFASPVAK
jgi:Glyoxalase/Bleomycin resistance protein/Dioxygenase superfamily